MDSGFSHKLELPHLSKSQDHTKNVYLYRKKTYLTPSDFRISPVICILLTTQNWPCCTLCSKAQGFCTCRRAFQWKTKLLTSVIWGDESVGSPACMGTDRCELLLSGASASSVPMICHCNGREGFLANPDFFHVLLNFQKAELSRMELTFLLSLREERGTWSTRQKNTLQRRQRNGKKKKRFWCSEGE